MNPVVRVAVIDIGTVTARLAVSDVQDGHLLRMAKQSTICNLGDGLAASRLIKDDARERVLKSVAAYLEAARAAQAPMVCCTLTSAARDAHNSHELTDGLHALGLIPQVIPGSVEGKLTFLGVAQDFPGRTILVADNGGGSTELALGKLTQAGLAMDYVRSLDVGCRRVTDLFLAQSDPPSPASVLEARAFARELFERAREDKSLHACEAELLVACGGTVTSLVAMEAELAEYSSAYVHLHELPQTAVAELVERLAALSVAERAELAGLQPQRASVILGGAIIIDELLLSMNFDRLTVSESDLLVGLSLTAASAVEKSVSPLTWTPKLAQLL